MYKQQDDYLYLPGALQTIPLKKNKNQSSKNSSLGLPFSSSTFDNTSLVVNRLPKNQVFNYPYNSQYETADTKRRIDDQQSATQTSCERQQGFQRVLQQITNMSKNNNKKKIRRDTSSSQSEQQTFIHECEQCKEATIKLHKKRQKWDNQLRKQIDDMDNIIKQSEQLRSFFQIQLGTADKMKKFINQNKPEKLLIKIINFVNTVFERLITIKVDIPEQTVSPFNDIMLHTRQSPRFHEQSGFKYFKSVDVDNNQRRLNTGTFAAQQIPYVKDKQKEIDIPSDFLTSELPSVLDENSVRAQKSSSKKKEIFKPHGLMPHLRQKKSQQTDKKQTSPSDFKKQGSATDLRKNQSSN